MRKMLNGLPLWPRMTLSGLYWGTACGLGAAAWMLLMFMTAEITVKFSVDEVDNLYYFVVDLIVYVAIASTIGVVLGGALGTATGMAAGAALALLVRRFSPAVAVAGTVAMVVGAQVAVGLAMPALAGTWWIWPAFAVVPLTLTARGAARDWVNRPELATRRDTLAA